MDQMGAWLRGHGLTVKKELQRVRNAKNQNFIVANKMRTRARANELPFRKRRMFTTVS